MSTPVPKKVVPNLAFMKKSFTFNDFLEGLLADAQKISEGLSGKEKKEFNNKYINRLGALIEANNELGSYNISRGARMAGMAISQGNAIKNGKKEFKNHFINYRDVQYKIFSETNQKQGMEKNIRLAVEGRLTEGIRKKLKTKGARVDDIEGLVKIEMGKPGFKEAFKREVKNAIEESAQIEMRKQFLRGKEIDPGKIDFLVEGIGFIADPVLEEEFLQSLDQCAANYLKSNADSAKGFNQLLPPVLRAVVSIVGLESILIDDAFNPIKNDGDKQFFVLVIEYLSALINNFSKLDEPVPKLIGALKGLGMEISVDEDINELIVGINTLIGRYDLTKAMEQQKKDLLARAEQEALEKTQTKEPGQSIPVVSAPPVVSIPPAPPISFKGGQSLGQQTTIDPKFVPDVLSKYTIEEALTKCKDFLAMFSSENPESYGQDALKECKKYQDILQKLKKEGTFTNVDNLAVLQSIEAVERQLAAHAKMLQLIENARIKLPEDASVKDISEYFLFLQEGTNSLDTIDDLAKEWGFDHNPYPEAIKILRAIADESLGKQIKECNDFLNSLPSSYSEENLNKCIKYYTILASLQRLVASSSAISSNFSGEVYVIANRLYVREQVLQNLKKIQTAPTDSSAPEVVAKYLENLGAAIKALEEIEASNKDNIADPNLLLFCSGAKAQILAKRDDYAERLFKGLESKFSLAETLTFKSLSEDINQVNLLPGSDTEIKVYTDRLNIIVAKFGARILENYFGKKDQGPGDSSPWAKLSTNFRTATKGKKYSPKADAQKLFRKNDLDFLQAIIKQVGEKLYDNKGNIDLAKAPAQLAILKGAILLMREQMEADKDNLGSVGRKRFVKMLDAMEEELNELMKTIDAVNGPESTVPKKTDEAFKEAFIDHLVEKKIDLPGFDIAEKVLISYLSGLNDKDSKAVQVNNALLNNLIKKILLEFSGKSLGNDKDLQNLKNCLEKLKATPDTPDKDKIVRGLLLAFEGKMIEQNLKTFYEINYKPVFDFQNKNFAVAIPYGLKFTKDCKDRDAIAALRVFAAKNDISLLDAKNEKKVLVGEFSRAVSSSDFNMAAALYKLIIKQHNNGGIDFKKLLSFSDKNGVTFLHHAVRKFTLHSIKDLIDRGADVNAKNKKGETPLDLLKGNNTPEVVSIKRMLAENGAQYSKDPEPSSLNDILLLGYSKHLSAGNAAAQAIGGNLLSMFARKKTSDSSENRLVLLMQECIKLIAKGDTNEITPQIIKGLMLFMQNELIKEKKEAHHPLIILVDKILDVPEINKCNAKESLKAFRSFISKNPDTRLNVFMEYAKLTDKEIEIIALADRAAQNPLNHTWTGPSGK